MKTTAEIRRLFLEFFKSKNHTIVDSSSLVPDNDPTLLFTNAGMNQFKDVFLGQDKRSYNRATTSQRCVRAGGKHNDLENVGFTSRHHTFFEMLGNFSFGDYFKEQAILFAWELLTGKEWFNIQASKLTVTVYHTDEEAYDIWLNKIGIPAEKIIRIGDKGDKAYQSDNFWQMGDTGPCGPCTEIFYDHGEHIFGGPPGSPDEDGDRFVEIWNIVFMQYNRLEDGQMLPLPKPSVDTGAGIERVAAVLQGVNSNYDIDIFKYLINEAKIITKQTEVSKSLNVIADHARACTFLVADGVIPSNEGRGYVLRRIIRRALRHGYLLGLKDAFLYKLVDKVIYIMADAADYLKDKSEFIKKIIRVEEQQFSKTIERGLVIINDEISKIKANNGNVLSGEVAFKLYDTYGFPLDLTNDLCREENISIDEKEFDILMAKQRELAKSYNKFDFDYSKTIISEVETVNLSYQSLSESAKVLAIYKNGEAVDSLLEGEDGLVITDKTPFYAESGGQIGDIGIASSKDCEFIISDTQKYKLSIGHHGHVLAGKIDVGDELILSVNQEIRSKIISNHSATHLLHAALRKVLGSHVQQKGSLVNDKLLRLDVSHNEPITAEQLQQVELIVNEKIRENYSVIIQEMSMEEAKTLGAMALFGEKYGDVVRVVSMSPFSIELCGGIHVSHTGDIGLFRIESEGSVSAGVRRIEATSGIQALLNSQEERIKFNSVVSSIKSNKSNVVEQVQQNLNKIKELEKLLAKANEKIALSQIDGLISQAKIINNSKVITAIVDYIDAKTLRSVVDDIKNRIGSGVVLLASKGTNIQLIVGVTKDLTNKLSAGAVISKLATSLNGKGGGKHDLAMASATDFDNLSNELDKTLNEIISVL